MKADCGWFVEHGGLSKVELLLKLSKQKICLNAYATILFMDDRFQTTGESKAVRVVEVTASSLGFSAPVIYADIVNSARDFNLGLCPLELAPYLRLEYKDQAQGPFLTVASDCLVVDEEYPNGFYLQNYSGHLWLRGYRSTSDWLWNPGDKFAFIDYGAEPEHRDGK